MQGQNLYQILTQGTFVYHVDTVVIVVIGSNQCDAILNFSPKSQLFATCTDQVRADVGIDTGWYGLGECAYIHILFMYWIDSSKNLSLTIPSQSQNMLKHPTMNVMNGAAAYQSVAAQPRLVLWFKQLKGQVHWTMMSFVNT